MAKSSQPDTDKPNTDKPNTDKSDASTSSDKKATLGSELRFYGLFLLGFLLFSTVGYQHFRIPSESMQPTLEVGDRLYVAKFAYGFSRYDIPFGSKMAFLGEGVLKPSYPERGDVVVFSNPNSGVVMIKRAVGLPGDEIQYQNGRLYINGALIERKEIDTFMYRAHPTEKGEEGYVQKVTQYEESWPGEEGSHMIYEKSDAERNDDRGPFSVPEGHVFFMGDNRDNSVDSRAPGGPGFVPVNRLIGRADRMVMSLKRCKEEEGLRCPGSRWFIKL